MTKPDDESKPGFAIFIDGPSCPTDGKPHEFTKWQDHADGLGGSAVCGKCGLSAMDYDLLRMP